MRINWLNKLKKVIFLLFLGIISSELAFSQMTFVHPGGVNGQVELDYVKGRIAAGAQPWTNNFNAMLPLATGVTNMTAPMDENGQKADARKAYANALAWYYTGNATYANNAIGVLNVWGNTFNGYPTTAGQDLLQGAWIGALLGPAAEIMRNYVGWVPADRTRVQNMFRNEFYPVLNTMSTWNGNVDLTQIDAMMNIAVFCEDETEFNLAISRLNARNPIYFYLASEGAPSNSGNWFAPTSWVDGLTQETCRDNGHHAQYALASALHAAEVAWNQGVDLYTPNQARYTAALELMALQIQSGQMQGTCGNNTATASLFATWEVGYNHYHNRKGINMPNTLSVLTNKIRPSGASDWNIFFETLTHNMTGYVAGPVITCSQPNLGPDISTCSVPLPTTLNANAGAPGGAISYRWYTWNGTTKTLIPSQTGQTYLASALGGYLVERDSAYVGGPCTKSDIIFITNTFPVPNFTTPLNLCSITSYDLTPSNLATFPVGTTWQWAVDYSGGTTYNDLSGMTASVLPNIRRAGNYRITGVAGACTNSGAVTITSNLPTAVDGCSGGPLSAVPMSITNNTGTNYNWYDAPTGGNLLPGGAGVISLNSPNISATTTYYVQDMNSISANVGPYFPATPTLYAGGGNIGADNRIQTRFEAIGNYAITELYIPYMLYNAGDAARRATFEIINDATGAVITTTPQYTGALASGTYGAQGVYIIRFNVNIPIVGGTIATPTILRIRYNVAGSPDNNMYSFNDNVDPFDGTMPLNWNYVDNAGGNTMRVIGSHIYGNPTTTRYAHFVGFKISAGASCGRLPVIAAIGECGIAPVELISFSAENNLTTTILNWTTASEKNNDYFIVQRSVDGVNFEAIGKVDGMGSKNGATSYSFVDENAPFGKVYYRLKQVDFNEQFSTSIIVSVTREEIINVSVAPNPFNNFITVSVHSDENLKLRIIDLSGQEVEETISIKNGQVMIGGQLSPGVYMLQLLSNTSVKTIKIVKQ